MYRIGPRWHRSSPLHTSIESHRKNPLGRSVRQVPTSAESARKTATTSHEMNSSSVGTPNWSEASRRPIPTRYSTSVSPPNRGPDGTKRLLGCSSHGPRGVPSDLMSCSGRPRCSPHLIHNHAHSHIPLVHTFSAALAQSHSSFWWHTCSDARGGVRMVTVSRYKG